MAFLHITTLCAEALSLEGTTWKNGTMCKRKYVETILTQSPFWHQTHIKMSLPCSPPTSICVKLQTPIANGSPKNNVNCLQLLCIGHPTEQILLC